LRTLAGPFVVNNPAFICVGGRGSISVIARVIYTYFGALFGRVWLDIRAQACTNLCLGTLAHADNCAVERYRRRAARDFRGRFVTLALIELSQLNVSLIYVRVGVRLAPVILLIARRQWIAGGAPLPEQADGNTARLVASHTGEGAVLTVILG
jgi:hypothetical protein